MGDRNPRGDLQHVNVTGGACGRESQAGPHTCEPDGGANHGEVTLALTVSLPFFS